MTVSLTPQGSSTSGAAAHLRNARPTSSTLLTCVTLVGHLTSAKLNQRPNWLDVRTKSWMPPSLKPTVGHVI